MDDRQYRQARTEDPGIDAEGSGPFMRAATFWGGALAALALVFAATYWLFDERGGGPVMVAPVAAAPADPLAPPVRISTLPPLVLLAPAANAAAKAVTAMPPPAKSAPVLARLPARPVLAKAAPKPSVQPIRKALLAKNAPLQAKAKPVLVAAKKPLAVAKRAGVPAKSGPKALAAREREPAPQQAAAKKCLPGELARECAARQWFR